MLYVVKIRNLLLRSRPSGHCEIVWVHSDGLAAASTARRLTDFRYLLYIWDKEENIYVLFIFTPENSRSAQSLNSF